MIAVFGNGMMGHAIARMINGDVVFMDNKLNNIEQALSLEPECIVLGVLDDARQNEMRNQLSSLGYNGPIYTYPKLFDVRVSTMRLIAETLPNGNIAELGVYKGDFAVEIAAALPNREIHLFDSFKGFDNQFTDTSKELVQSRLPKAVIHEGFFPSTFEAHDYAFLSLDADLYEPTRDALKLFWPCMVKDGIIMIHDYNSNQFPGVKQAVDEFCTSKNIVGIPVADLHGSLILKK